jgi:hypothetical protein
MYKCSKDPRPGVRESSLRIFAQLCEYLGKALAAHTHVLHDVITSNLTHSDLNVSDVFCCDFAHLVIGPPCGFERSCLGAERTHLSGAARRIPRSDGPHVAGT